MSTRERWFLAGLLLLSIILRFWNLIPTFEFLDDQGRDAIVAKRILKDGDLTLLGPGTSVGAMYLGPAYYYAMVPFLWLTYPSPAGPALAVAMVGVLTVALTYLLGKRMFGAGIASIAAVLMAVTPSIVQLSRFSWQPNPSPLFGLLFFYAVWKTEQGAVRWWLIAGLMLAILLQLHYVALSVLVPAGILAGAQILRSRTSARHLKRLMLWFIASAVVVMLSFAPLIAFDVRHDGLIRRGFDRFFTEQRERRPFLDRAVQIAQNTHGRGMYMLVEIWGLSKEQRLTNGFLLLALWLSAVIGIIKQKQVKQRNTFLMLVCWIGMVLLVISAYEGTFAYHYLGFLFPLIAFFVSFGLTWWSTTFGLRLMVWGVILGWLAMNLPRFPFWNPAGATFLDFQEVSRLALSYLPSKARYNVALLNDNREYKGNKYRYFLEVSSSPPRDQYSYDSLEYLIILVENGEQPLQSPVFEVQQFVRENQGAPTLLTEFDYRGIVKGYIYRKR